MERMANRAARTPQTAPPTSAFATSTAHGGGAGAFGLRRNSQLGAAAASATTSAVAAPTDKVSKKMRKRKLRQDKIKRGMFVLVCCFRIVFQLQVALTCLCVVLRLSQRLKSPAAVARASRCRCQAHFPLAPPRAFGWVYSFFGYSLLASGRVTRTRLIVDFLLKAIPPRFFPSNVR